jgi:predicted DNA-binding protein
MQNTITINKKTPYKSDEERGIKQAGIRLTKEEHEALQKLAEKKYRSISSIIRELVVKLLKDEKQLENSSQN